MLMLQQSDMHQFCRRFLFVLQVTTTHRYRKQVQVDDATQDVLSTIHGPHGHTSTKDSSIAPSSAAAGSQMLATPELSASVEQPTTPVRKRSKSSAKPKAEPETDVSPLQPAAPATDCLPHDTASEQMPVVLPKKKRKTRSKPNSVAEASPVEAVAAAVEAVTKDEDGGGHKKVKRQQVKATEVAVKTETEALDAPASGEQTTLSPVCAYLIFSRRVRHIRLQLSTLTHNMCLCT